VDATVATGSAVSSSTQYIYSKLFEITSAVTSINIEKLAADAKAQTQQYLRNIMNTPALVQNLGSEAKESLQGIIKSVNDITNNEEHPINGMNVVGGVKGTVLSYIPGYKSLEHLFKCFVYMSLNATLQLLMSSSYFSNLTNEQKDQVVIDLSKVFISNTLDPIGLATGLVEFTVSKLDVGGIENYKLLMQIGRWVHQTQELIRKLQGGAK
jgi:hypothetical protein